jgi:hypothetical protein
MAKFYWTWIFPYFLYIINMYCCRNHVLQSPISYTTRISRSFWGEKGGRAWRTVPIRMQYYPHNTPNAWEYVLLPEKMSRIASSMLHSF